MRKEKIDYKAQGEAIAHVFVESAKKVRKPKFVPLLPREMEAKHRFELELTKECRERLKIQADRQGYVLKRYLQNILIQAANDFHFKINQ